MNDNPLRQALWPLSLLYAVAAALRNWSFDAGLRAVHRLPVPVVAVGNLTVGGTGKTPAVLWLAALAHRLGRRVGVLARGYGRARGSELNDEGAMLQARLPFLLQEQDPDRVAAGRRLVERGADFVILDDGFQHRRLHRDLDLLCLDAALPFGNGLCLPAGDLREPRSGLRRAGVVLLTRADAVDAQGLAAREHRIRQLAGRSELPIHACFHRPLDVVVEPGFAQQPLSWLRGRRVVLLSAVARPQSFHSTVAALGAEIAGDLRYRDHHWFTPAEVEAAAAAARDAGAVLLVTEKDAVRLVGSGKEYGVLRIELCFPDREPSPAEVGL